MSNPLHTPARLLASAALCALLAAGAGCHGGSSHATGETVDARAKSVPVTPDAYSALGYRLQWRGYATMLPGQHIKFLDIFGDIVVAQETGSMVSILEVKSGDRRWSDQAGNPLTKFIGNLRDGNRLIVSSESEVLFYDTDTGALTGKQLFDQVVNTRPVQVGAVLVYGASSGQVIGHLRLNGFRLWGSTVNGAIETDPVPVGSDGTVGLISRNGDILFLDGNSGFGRGRNHIYAGSDADLAASDNLLFVASTDHSLYAFGRDGGVMVWRQRTDAPLRNAPTYYDNRVYCDMGSSGFCAFDANTGQRIWATAGVSGSAVVMRHGRLIVWNSPRAVSLDPADGSVIESVTLDKISILKADKFVDGDLYASSSNGVISRLVPKN